MMRLSAKRWGLLALLVFIYCGGSKAEQLVGFSSEHTIPDAIFEQQPAGKPWIQRQPVKKATPLPATTQNVQQQNQIRMLEKSLSDQKQSNTRADNELKLQLADNEQLKIQIAEKEKTLSSLMAELAILKDTKGEMTKFQQEFEQLKVELETSKNELINANQQIADLRLQLAAHLLRADNLQLQQLAGEVLFKEQSQAFTDAREENAALKNQVVNLTAELKAQESPIQQKLLPETHQQKLDYANGVAFANNIVQSLSEQQNLGIDANRPMVLAGIIDSLERKTVLNADEVETLVKELDEALNSKLLAREDKDRQSREKQREAGKQFFAEMKQAKGVKELNGALYRVVKAGKGEKLSPESTIEILLIGRLPDGTVFDNSGTKNIPQQVKVNSLLPGIANVLNHVNVGSVVEVVLPPELAFGEKGLADFIPGEATLIFTITISKVI